jgi:probable rRNA maturation factor
MPERVVEVSCEQRAGAEDLVPELEAAAHHALEAEGAGEIELSIALVSDATIEELNGRYLDRDGPTDVISFPLQQPGALLVGDVYIGAEQARRQADEAGVPLREELLRLVIHGTLHVLGWEHPEEAEERQDSPMYRRQEELLASFLSPP